MRPEVVNFGFLLMEGSLEIRPGIAGSDLATGVHSQLSVVRHSKISSVDV